MSTNKIVGVTHGPDAYSDDEPLITLEYEDDYEALTGLTAEQSTVEEAARIAAEAGLTECIATPDRVTRWR